MKCISFAFVALFLAAFTTLSAADKKLIVMIAGKPSHGPGQHEHNAGIQLFKNAWSRVLQNRCKSYIT
jgi:hypothetical protein